MVLVCWYRGGQEGRYPLADLGRTASAAHPMTPLSLAEGSGLLLVGVRDSVVPASAA